VFIARRGRSELTTTILGVGQLAELVERMLRSSGRRIEMSAPFVDAMLPDGSRLHVVVPDVIRRHIDRHCTPGSASRHPPLSEQEGVPVPKAVRARSSGDEGPERSRFVPRSPLLGSSISVALATRREGYRRTCPAPPAPELGA
jgi:hypothetical protein